MREIRFKAWDRKEKKWFVPTYEAYRGRLESLLIGLGGDLFMHTLDGLFHESKFRDRFELVEYTGLSDKNGREIYEGDLLRRPGYESVWKVAWWIDGFFKENANAGHAHIDEGEEIIGTVYETPELMR